jgi:NADH:ubiquinone oxidoreductase subunit 3 (subunit A)
MKKILLFLFLLATGECYSATGNASDGMLAILAILGFLMLLLAIVTFTGYIGRQIRSARDKRQVHQERFENGEEPHLSITASPAV